jgi:hypothetical protein
MFDPIAMCKFLRGHPTLTHLELDTDNAIENREFHESLPHSLIRLSFSTYLRPMDANPYLPPNLTQLKLACLEWSDTFSHHLPRGITHLQLGFCHNDANDLSGLPPSLTFLDINEAGFNSEVLSTLPHSLRFCHIPFIKIPDLPREEKGVVALVRRWWRSESDGTMEALERVMNLPMPPNCLFSTHFRRESILLPPESVLTHTNHAFRAFMMEN